MFEGFDGSDGFSLEDLADEEQAQIGQQGQTSTGAVAAAASQNIAPPDVQQAPAQQLQTPIYSQQWQQWDAQRRAGNIQPVPTVTPTPATQTFPWAKVLVGAGIAAAVVYGVIKLQKRSKKSNPKSDGSWHSIGD